AALHVLTVLVVFASGMDPCPPGNGCLCDARAVSRDAHPVSCNAHPVSYEARPVSCNARPVSYEARPVSCNARPVSYEAGPVSYEARAIPFDVPSPIYALEVSAPTRGTGTSASPPVLQTAADRWTGEDKFRHAAASWAAMVFTYGVVRAVDDDPDTALAIALPVTAVIGIAKEVSDHRRGGPFSFRDLAADALGAGAAWLFLREVR
ncbi:MAG: hypothetical protein KFH98_03105, partial [Gemmatimonadetes bacterium]|nr:hypothetical protein [Gemmatimonadota bacterium]